MKLTVEASWEWVEDNPRDEIRKLDAEWVLNIAGAQALVMWRADYISWDVTYPGGGGEGGSFPAFAGYEHGEGGLSDDESDRLYELAKDAAERSIIEAFALRAALI